jgi:hypothetical protein
MVMDASQTNVRRYWTGHGWTTDPVLGIQSRQEGGIDGYYCYLVDRGCQAALVLVEMSFTPERTTVHNIQVRESTTWRA